MSSQLPLIEPNAEAAIDLSALDVSAQIGREIVIYSEQYPGRPLKTRISAVKDDTIIIDRGGTGGLIDSLVHNQQIIAQLEYKGEKLALQGILKRTPQSKCLLQVGEKVVPLVRRRYVRLGRRGTIRFAIKPTSSFDPSRLNRLRWVETDSVNISSGGVQISTNGSLDVKTTLFINVISDLLEVPALMMGTIRHCFAELGGRFSVGVEFVVREERHLHLSPADIKKLPPIVFGYSRDDRVGENKKLMTWMHDNPSD